MSKRRKAEVGRIVVSEAVLNLHRVAAKERGRYALHGVLVEEDGTAVAADGRMMLAVGPIPDRVADTVRTECDFEHGQLDDSVMVEADQLKEARKNLPNKKDSSCEEERCTAELTVDDHEVRIGTSGQYARAVSGAPVEGQFPDYGAIIKGRSDTHARITFNACLMEQLCNAMRRAAGESKSGSMPVTLEVRDRDKPMIMRGTTTIGGGQDIVGALSPIIPEDYSSWKDDPADIQGRHDRPSRWETLLEYPATVRREVSALWSIADGAADRADRLASWETLQDKCQCERETSGLPAVQPEGETPAVERAEQHVRRTVERHHGAAAPHVG